MKSITYSVAHETLATTMQQVCDDREPVIITLKRDQAVVIMSLDEYESLQETAYLVRSPANSRRLRLAINQLDDEIGNERNVPPSLDDPRLL